ncbi:TetR family transcriptional regulator [Nocardioides agariphilus]|jgi:AcrR family transcriptional regulator|uniref:TetR family transcriptional regulator n=1 Tax=Nocardioides agariphilus TaxID=433664 RepID=A0A930VP97_9ACTN|nr:TetR family transcriptional regulator [Nocardioides agariphilus]MBF4768202.1 TetR family transcriptional regulator [Nocardioides agariphilus]
MAEQAAPGSPRGRRKGSPDTRSAILAAARSSFAELGFAGTTIRAVAASAGVDAALVHHYFGTKDELFLAALELPVDPRKLMGPAIAGPIEQAAERFLGIFLSVWDDPDLSPSLIAVARGIMDPAGSRLLTEGVLPVVIEPIGAALGIDDPQRRMSLVASQVIGLILMRYVLAVEPLASMSREQLITIYAPTLQRYLTGDLP